jgi:hypothetical protein
MGLADRDYMQAREARKRGSFVRAPWLARFRFWLWRLMQALRGKS